MKQQHLPEANALQSLTALDQKLSGFGSILLVLFPCIALAFPIKLASYHLGAITVIWLYLSVREKSKFKFRVGGLSPALPFLNCAVLLLGMLTTSNFVMGVKTLETKIPLFILPMIFFSGHDLIRSRQKQNILLIYSIGVALVCAFVMIQVLFRPSSSDVGYTFENLSSVIDLHPGYFSLYVGFAILLLILQFNCFSTQAKIMIAITLIFLLVFDLLLVARMPIIGLIAAILVYLAIVKNFRILILVVAVITTFLFAIGYQNPDWTHRILGPMEMLLSGDFARLSHFAYDRVQELSCTLELLMNDTNLLTGFGTGDDNDALFGCYAKHGYDWVLSQKYNAHNQYLQNVLQNGVISGILCLALIGAPLFSKSVKSPANLDFILFSCLFGIFSLTESTLEVQKGVVFFSFFYGLFTYYAKKDNTTIYHSISGAP